MVNNNIISLLPAITQVLIVSANNVANYINLTTVRLILQKVGLSEFNFIYRYGTLRDL